MRSRRFFHKKSSKNCPPGGVKIFECGAKALMDGVIVAVTHDEFRGWSFRACVGFGCRGGGG